MVYSSALVVNWPEALQDLLWTVCLFVFVLCDGTQRHPSTNAAGLELDCDFWQKTFCISCSVLVLASQLVAPAYSVPPHGKTGEQQFNALSPSFAKFALVNLSLVKFPAAATYRKIKVSRRP